MRGDTEFDVGGKTLTWDELDCLCHVNTYGSISRNSGGALRKAVVDSLESKGLLIEVGEHHQWADADATSWYSDNVGEIQSIINDNLGESDMECGE